PEGGFCFISVGSLLGCWQTYQDGNIHYQDVRVWLAAHELAARRCRTGKGCKPAYRAEEFGKLMERGGGRSFAASLRRLETFKLLLLGNSALTFPKPESRPRQDRRLVPVPRRTIRFLARCTKPVVAATVLGHLVRCLFFRSGACHPRGTCKASWV